MVLVVEGAQPKHAMGGVRDGHAPTLSARAQDLRGEENSTKKLEVEEMMTDDGAKEPKVKDKSQKETHLGLDLPASQEPSDLSSFGKVYEHDEAEVLPSRKEDETQDGTTDDSHRQRSWL